MADSPLTQSNDHGSLIRRRLAPLLALGLVASGCSKPETPPWKQALIEGTVIKIDDSQQDAVVRRTPRATLGSPEALEFSAPPPPPQVSEKPLISQKGEAPLAAPSLTPSVTSRSANYLPPLPEKPPVSPPAKPAVAPKKAATPLVDEKVLKQCEELLEQSRARYAAMTSYQADLVKQERQPNNQFEQQTIRILAHRPTGRLLLEWLDTRRVGRRVAYDSTQPESDLWIRLGPNEPKFLGATIHLPPDHPLVRRGNRHPINRLGIGAWIANLEDILQRNVAGDARRGVVDSVTEPTAADSATTRLRVRYIDESTMVGTLSPGGYRDWSFDKTLELPIRVVAIEADGAEQEDYRLTNIHINPSVNPDELLLD